MKPLYYDRQGNPLTFEQFLAAFSDGPSEHRTVGQTRLDDGTLISTIWLAIDHNFGSGPPLIFETMIFGLGFTSMYEYQERYSTEAEARAGHAFAVAFAKACRARKLTGGDARALLDRITSGEEEFDLAEWKVDGQ